MKIALIGYGKMGKMIEKSALNKGHEIVACFNSDEWNLDDLKKADVCIEFTQPEAVLSNIKRLAELKKAVVVGTTGWYDRLDELNSMVKEHDIGVIYSPNYSIGINLVFQILAHAGKLMASFEEYDVAGVEYHHREKKDSPSGTALGMAEVLKKNMHRDVPLSSVRCGSIPGTHTILFDSPHDTISVTHEARNREGFANGAVLAAEWLQGKKGVHTFKEVFEMEHYETQS